MEGMRVSLFNRSVVLNIVALTILFVGYLLTTGAGVFDSEGAKATFRIVSFFVFFANLLIGGKINEQILIAVIFTIFFLLLSKSPLAGNIIFLLLISASLSRLNVYSFSIVLLIPTVLLVAAHFLLLITGVVSVEAVEIGSRVNRFITSVSAY